MRLSPFHLLIAFGGYGLAYWGWLTYKNVQGAYGVSVSFSDIWLPSKVGYMEAKVHQADAYWAKINAPGGLGSSSSGGGFSPWGLGFLAGNTSSGATLTAAQAAQNQAANQSIASMIAGGGTPIAGGAGVVTTQAQSQQLMAQACAQLAAAGSPCPSGSY